MTILVLCKTIYSQVLRNGKPNSTKVVIYTRDGTRTGRHIEKRCTAKVLLLGAVYKSLQWKCFRIVELGHSLVTGLWKGRKSMRASVWKNHIWLSPIVQHFKWNICMKLYWTAFTGLLNMPWNTNSKLIFLVMQVLAVWLLSTTTCILIVYRKSCPIKGGRFWTIGILFIALNLI